MITLLFLLLTLGAQAEKVGVLELQLPPDFYKMSKEEIANKFPPVRPPQAAFANNRRVTVTVAINHTQSKLSPAQLGEFGAFMKKTVGAMGELEKDETVTINGNSWYRLVLKTEAADQPIRNEMLMTSADGRALLINLNSTVKDYPAYQKQLDAIRNSLKIVKP